MTQPAISGSDWPQALREAVAEAAGPLMERLVDRARLALAHDAATIHLRLGRGAADLDPAAFMVRQTAELAAAFTQALGDHLAEGPTSRPVPLDLQSLELMTEDQVLETVERVRARHRMEAETDLAMTRLTSLVAGLRGRRIARAKDNPLPSEVWVDAIATAAHRVNVPFDLRALWVRHLGNALVEELPATIDRLCGLLSALGTQPAPWARDGESDSVPPPSAAPAPADTLVQAGSAGSAEGLDLLALWRLISRRARHHGAGGAVASAPAPLRGGDTTIPSVLVTLMDMGGAPEVIERIQLQQELAPPPAGDDPLALRAAATAALSQEVVRLVLLRLCEDPQVLPSMRAVLMDLEPALQRIALNDPRFFWDTGHPARALMQAMLRRSGAWADEAGTGYGEFLHELRDAVQALRELPMLNAEPFEFTLAMLEQSWERESNREQQRQSQARRALRWAARRNAHAAEIAADFRSRPDLASAPRFVRRFLLGPWAQVVATERLKDETESGTGDPQTRLSLVDDLLWSVQARLVHNHRSRLAHKVPGLLQGLREGLGGLALDDTEIRAFFNELADLHQRLMRGELPPEALPDAAVPGLEVVELDSDFWMAPAEARDSGFIADTQPAAETLPDTQPSAGDRAALGEPALPPRLPDLRLGSWWDLVIDSVSHRWRLDWVGPGAKVFLFADAAGQTHALSRLSVERLAVANAIVAVAAAPSVTGAFDAVARAALQASARRDGPPPM